LIELGAQKGKERLRQGLGGTLRTRKERRERKHIGEKFVRF